VYLCHGNHDPYVTWQSEFALLPANCHRFSAQGPSFFTYKRDGEPLAIIGGRSYYNAVFPANEDISSGISREEAYQAEGVVVPFVVGVLHSGLDIDPTRSPVSPRVLNSRGVDYWALGHIHNRLLYPEDHPTIAFSGAPQARATKETGPHGILKVTLEEGKANQARFIDTAPVEWQRFTVDVSDCLTVSDIQETITNRQFKMNGDSHSQDMIFRVKLEGRTPLHGKLTSAVLEQMRTFINEGFPFFYLDAIIDRTSPQLDEDALRREGLFPAVFLGALEDELANPDELLATLEEDFQQLGFAMPTSTKRNLVKRAAESRTLVLDLLDRGERE
jgi:DNA repair exonuclease SbcCD nuclease subunit